MTQGNKLFSLLKAACGTKKTSVIENVLEGFDDNPDKLARASDSDVEAALTSAGVSEPSQKVKLVKDACFDFVIELGKGVTYDSEAEMPSGATPDRKGGGDEDDDEEPGGKGGMSEALRLVAMVTGKDPDEVMKKRIKSVPVALKRIAKATTSEDRQAIVDYLLKNQVTVVAYLGDDIQVELTEEMAGTLNDGQADNLVRNGLDSEGNFYEFRPVSVTGLWPTKDDTLFWFSPFRGDQLTVIKAVKSATDSQGNNLGKVVIGREEKEALDRMAFLRWMIENSKVSVGSEIERATAIGYVSGPAVADVVAGLLRAWSRLDDEAKKPYLDAVRRKASTTTISHPPNPGVPMRKSLTMEELANASKPWSPGGGRY